MTQSGARLITPLPVTLYITEPDKKNDRAEAREKTAVLYLTDVFGIALPENKLFVPPSTFPFP